jgi:hypothetical protein
MIILRLRMQQNKHAIAESGCFSCQVTTQQAPWIGLLLRLRHEEQDKKQQQEQQKQTRN